MSRPERESRLTENEAAQELSPKPTTTSVKPIERDPAKPAGKIGAAVEAQLDATLWKLQAGTIGLHDLTPGLMAFYAIGHSDGIASIAPQLEQAICDRDRYYSAAFSPRQPINIGPTYAALEATRRNIFSGGTE